MLRKKSRPWRHYCDVFSYSDDIENIDFFTLEQFILQIQYGAFLLTISPIRNIMFY